MSKRDIYGVVFIVAFISFVAFVVFLAPAPYASVEYECLAYGYPQYRSRAGSPSYCIRHIFGVDEVRTLEELRAKEKE